MYGLCAASVSFSHAAWHNAVASLRRKLHRKTPLRHSHLSVVAQRGVCSCLVTFVCYCRHTWAVTALSHPFVTAVTEEPMSVAVSRGSSEHFQLENCAKRHRLPVCAAVRDCTCGLESIASRLGLACHTPRLSLSTESPRYGFGIVAFI